MAKASGGGPKEDEPVETDSKDDSEEDEIGGFDSWRRESALGAVGTGIARGLHAVFAPRADEVVIVAAVPDDPTKSIAVVPKAPLEPPSE